MRERLLHALDLGMLGDWDGAKRSLENLDDPIVMRLTALFMEQQRRELERAEVQAIARHELGNAISIAHANMEALVDGVLQATPERLSAIRDALVTCGVLLDDLKKQYRSRREVRTRVAVFDVCDLVNTQVALVSGIAESKNVRVRYTPRDVHPESCAHYRGDRDRVALVLRDALLGAVRYTPPGGAIEIGSVQPGGEIELSISMSEAGNGGTPSFSVPAKLLDAVGGHVRIVDETPQRTMLVLKLPAKRPD